MNNFQKAELALSVADKILEKLMQFDYEPPVFQAALALCWAQSCLMEDVSSLHFKQMTQDIIVYFDECKKILNNSDPL